jgi:hypothetical protein
MSENFIDNNHQDFLKDEAAPIELKRKSWSGFVESEVLNFFEKHDFEKLSIEDGNGNKAKLTHTKDSGIRIEYSSTVIL